MAANDYLIASYVTCVIAVVAFAAYASVMFFLSSRRQRADPAKALEDFVTARKSQPVYRIAWSFFASAVGAWVIVSPASYTSYAGAIGMAFYSVSAGLPIIGIALIGDKIQRKYPNILSIGDYAGYRFGPTAKVFVVLVTIFNMSIAMLAEYTTIGSLFKDFVGSVNYPIIITVGVLTLIYTAYGGLAVSIMTDQIQGILTITLVAVLSIYVGVTFKGDLPADLGVARDAALPAAMRWYTYESLGPNVYGYSAILVMPVSLMSATLFSEAMWQRVWASADRRTLLVGASLGCAGVIVVTFFFCFCGFLAVWAGYAVYGVTNPNLYLFQVFRDEGQKGAAGASVTVSSWIGVVTLVLAITMNESAIDSLQNGLAASISAHFFKGMSVWYARLAVALVNIPLIIIGTQNFNVLALFLVTNLLCCCCAIPLGLGTVDRLKPYLSESAMLSGCVTGILTLTAYGIGVKWIPGNTAKSFAVGADFAWYGNGYLWDYFLVATCFSVVGVLLWVIPAQLLKRFSASRARACRACWRASPAGASSTASGRRTTPTRRRSSAAAPRRTQPSRRRTRPTRACPPPSRAPAACCVPPPPRARAACPRPHASRSHTFPTHTHSFCCSSPPPPHAPLASLHMPPPKTPMPQHGNTSRPSSSPSMGGSAAAWRCPPA